MGDALVIMPGRTDTVDLLKKINNIHHIIKFMVEGEIYSTLSFLDTKIIKGEKYLKFSIYRKPINKEDFPHFYSAHNKKTKSGIITGFFLRALRICSQEYL